MVTPKEELTDEQKAEIQKEFREWSGGYHPGECDDRKCIFVDDWADTYGHEALEDYLEEWGEEEGAKDNLRHLAHQALPPARTSCPAEDLWLEYQTPLPTSLRSGLTAPGCGLCANTGLVVTHGRHPVTAAPIQLPCICPNGRALKAKSR